tara:strand:+ start:15721 stop:16011 length:291 start_codon:yes stop_codon:yes gene_type:complete
MQITRPGGHDIKSSLASSFVETPHENFTIQMHALAGEIILQRINPLDQTFRESDRGESGEDSTERIVRGNSIRQQHRQRIPLSGISFFKNLRVLRA